MSNPTGSRYVFSNVEDPNDEGALRKALAAIELGRPGTFGGQFRDPENVDRVYESFTTHTPPDITENTRVIAVLGILQDNATPNRDGWFLSDFLAFHHVLRKATKNQTWLHSLDLSQLIDKHDRYLHGNPYLARKVVLDRQILEKITDEEFGHPLTRVKPTDLKLQFKKCLKEQCQKASAASDVDDILILIFGHWIEKNLGIEIGSGRNILLRKNLADVLSGMNPNITLITTACFSGGWTCYPQHNMSTMTAAGELEKSRSWTRSASSGRACGSMFTTAIIQKLIINNATGKSVVDLENEDENVEEQDESYADFTRSVYENLLNGVDRRGMEHGITFSAQDDAWSMNWRQRTGIPLHDYAACWEELEEWPSDQTLHPGDPQNRDPRVTDEVRADWAHLKAQDAGKSIWDPMKGMSYDALGAARLGKRKTSGLYGGTNEGLTTMVTTLAKEYLESYRGQDDTGDDGSLHGLLFDIIQGRERDPIEIDQAYHALKYRLEQMSAADEYLDFMRVPLPRGQSCREYDTKNVVNTAGSRYRSLIRYIFDLDIIFPSPCRDQGRPFHKGHQYIIAAFCHAEIPDAVAFEQLDMLAAKLEKDVEDRKEYMKQDFNITSKRQRLFASFGVDLGSVSPTKRRSRRLSILQN